MKNVRRATASDNIGCTTLIKDKLQFWVWRIVSICCILICTASLHAQLVLLRGDKFPKHPMEGTFFHNSETKKLYLFELKEWSQCTTVVADTAAVCNEFIWVKGNGEEALVSGLGFRMLNSFQGIFCGDSVTGMWSSDGTVGFFNRSKQYVAYFNGRECGWTGEKMNIQGQSAYCLPAVFGGGRDFRCSEIHNWGILGSNGQWLVEPKFDAPFNFENGIADVLYYGQKRKINEKGEFVE